jgi:hypothetical protein
MGVYVHLTNLTRDEPCDLTYDNRTDPSVGGNGNSNGQLNFDRLMFSPGSHTILVKCHPQGAAVWSTTLTVNVGGSGAGG